MVRKLYWVRADGMRWGEMGGSCPLDCGAKKCSLLSFPNNSWTLTSQEVAVRAWTWGSSTRRWVRLAVATLSWWQPLLRRWNFQKVQVGGWWPGRWAEVASPDFLAAGQLRAMSQPCLGLLLLHSRQNLRLHAVHFSWSEKDTVLGIKTSPKIYHWRHSQQKILSFYNVKMF